MKANRTVNEAFKLSLDRQMDRPDRLIQLGAFTVIIGSISIQMSFSKGVTNFSVPRQ